MPSAFKKFCLVSDYRREHTVNTILTEHAAVKLTFLKHNATNQQTNNKTNKPNN
jgi:hypothetical protein